MSMPRAWLRAKRPLALVIGSLSLLLACNCRNSSPESQPTEVQVRVRQAESDSEQVEIRISESGSTNDRETQAGDFRDLSRQLSGIKQQKPDVKVEVVLEDEAARKRRNHAVDAVELAGITRVAVVDKAAPVEDSPPAEAGVTGPETVQEPQETAEPPEQAPQVMSIRRDADLEDEDQDADALANELAEAPDIGPLPEGHKKILKGQVIWLPKEQEIWLRGRVVQRDVPLEYLAVFQGGKDYESVLVVYADARVAHAAILLLGVKDRADGGGLTSRGERKIPQGDPLHIFVEWQNDDNEWQRTSANNIVRSVAEDTTMPDVPWVFTGSRWETDPQGDAHYMAEVEKSMVAVFHDPHAIINIPLMAGANDETYEANPDVLPPKGTPVRLVLKRAPQEALKRAIEIEEQRQKEAEAEGETESDAQGHETDDGGNGGE